MADELIENVEYSKKKKDEEEPILVAQRHLNIFHQIHIFNQARKDQFDQMLLDLPDEIRVLFSTLPGGSLLQEHIEELELKRGMMDENELEESSEKRKKDARDLLAKTTKQSNGDVHTIGLDPSFATTLATSLGKALQQADQRHRDDIQALTKSMAESQANMMAMVRELLAARTQETHSEPQNKARQFEPTGMDGQPRPSKKQKNFLEKILKTKGQNPSSVPEPKPEPVVVTEPEPAPEPVAVSEPKPEPVVVSEPKSEPVVVSEPKPEPVVVSEPKPEPVVVPEPKPEPVVVPETKSEPVVVSEPEPVAAPEPEPEPVAAPVPKPEPVVAPEPEPVAAPAPQPVMVSEPVAAPEPEPVAVPESVVAPEPKPVEDFKFTENPKTESTPEEESTVSPLPPEIEKIRQALTKTEKTTPQKATEQPASIELPEEVAALSQEEDTFSLDDLDITPISLDDNLEPTIDSQSAPQTEPQAQSNAGSDDEWEWEYVEDDGKTDEEGDDWEWAYVEDNAPDQNTNNNQK